MPAKFDEILHDCLQDAEKRLGNANSTLNQLKTDTERRIRDKDDELDAMRLVSSVITSAEEGGCFWCGLFVCLSAGLVANL